MLKTIHLHGELAERFEPSYKLAVETPAEGLRALVYQVRGFEQALREGEFICIRGNYSTGVECDMDHLKLNFGAVDEFHLIPAAVGRKEGAGKILIGILMIGAVIFTGGLALAGGAMGAAMVAGGGVAFGGLAFGSMLSAFAFGVGAMFVLSGAAMLLAPTPSAGNAADEKSGFLFNGPINTAEQGGACPLVFGRVRAGSVVVSAGITAERIAVSVSGSGGGGSSGAGEASDPSLAGQILFSVLMT